MKNIYFFNLFLLLTFPFLNCLQKEKKDNSKLLILGGLLYVNAQNNQNAADYNCATSPSPVSFSDFLSSLDSLNTSGYKCSECHGVNTAQSNFIITNYATVKERVNGNNPKASVLYFKVRPGGSMNAYSNAAVRQSIYCWISNGANF